MKNGRLCGMHGRLFMFRKTRKLEISGGNVNIIPNIWNIKKKSLSLQQRFEK